VKSKLGEVTDYDIGDFQALPVIELFVNVGDSIKLAGPDLICQLGLARLSS
jgi:hypothetical protein